MKLRLHIPSVALFACFVAAVSLPVTAYASEPAQKTVKLSKKQKKAYKKRMAKMAHDVRMRRHLVAINSYQDATDCTALMMEIGIDYSDNHTLASLSEYAGQVATWQTVRSDKAEAEAVDLVDLKAVNYCDLISQDCGNSQALETMLETCRAKYAEADKVAAKQGKGQ